VRSEEAAGQRNSNIFGEAKVTQEAPKSRWQFTQLLALLVIIPALALIYWLATRGAPEEVTVLLFQLSRQEIVAGETATLSWNVHGPAKVEITPDIGQVANGGEQTIKPVQDTVYALHATDSAGKVYQAISRIIVHPKPVATSIAAEAPRVPPAIQFQSSRQEIVVGDTVTLSWSVSGPTKTIEITPDVGKVANEGQQQVTPAADTFYTLHATDPAGRVFEATSRIVVRAKPAEVSNDQQKASGTPLPITKPLLNAEDLNDPESGRITASFNKSQEALAAGFSSQYHIIRMKNDCAVGTITVAIRFQSLDRTWVTRGWWSLDPHTDVVASSAYSRNGFYYFYATGGGRAWSGKPSDSNAIDIKVVDDHQFTQIGPISDSIRGKNPRVVKAFRKDYLGYGEHLISFTCEK